MEKITKTIKVDTELVEVSGDTKIINSQVDYNFNILLKSEYVDFGFFDSINIEEQ